MAIWLITGCSTGLGRSLVEVALSAGHRVVATARDVGSIDEFAVSHPESALVLPLDVRNEHEAARAVENAIAGFGGIDVLVNNAGYGYRSAVEEASNEPVAQLFAANFFGAVTMIKAVLPHMRHRRSGHIVNISSISARVPPAGSGYYAASKAALEALSGSLREELRPLGISVTTVEPGPLRTDFAGRSLQQSPTTIADYSSTAGRRRKEHDVMNGAQPGDPHKAARLVVAAVEAAHPPKLLLLGKDAVRRFIDAANADLDEIGRWQEQSTRTDFDDGA